MYQVTKLPLRQIFVSFEQELKPVHVAPSYSAKDSANRRLATRRVRFSDNERYWRGRG